ncbi:MAG: FMN-binding glutamate synthase family protein [Gammaproteobacteria bacterium]|nr:FMN-binding glutamate synthase family protein [Gammaproteobacteria bacterium]
MFHADSFGLEVLGWLAAIFIFVVGLFILFLIGVFIADITQTKHAIRRNYPVIGHLRYFFEHIGTFFRQYFFTMDREEMPFNRAQRSWVYRAAKNIDNTIAFGSTRDLHPSGTVLFVNHPFPTLGKDAVEPRNVTISESYADKPYITSSIFNISGMSYGAISKPAVLALSYGARKAGSWMNTGEGGLSPFHLEGGADIVFQIGTAKYGVRNEAGNLSDQQLRQVAAHEQVRMFELKLSQGAKPGKGGILPAEKVSKAIADIRGIPAGKDSISPNRHPEIQNNDDLLNMIHHIRTVTGKPVGFKAVVGDTHWIDELCKCINQRGREYAPDFITIDSADGGTGAAPQSLMDYVGLPIQESLPLVVDSLVNHDLRERIKVIASGKLINPSEVAWALCMGADFIVSARGFMFALGCIQALQCNKNTCPTGITTHDAKLQKGLVAEQKSSRVQNYINNIVYEVGLIAHACGVRSPRELNRSHARVVLENGTSISLAEIYPCQSSVH